MANFLFSRCSGEARISQPTVGVRQSWKVFMLGESFSLQTRVHMLSSWDVVSRSLTSSHLSFSVLHHVIDACLIFRFISDHIISCPNDAIMVLVQLDAAMRMGGGVSAQTFVVRLASKIATGRQNATHSLEWAGNRVTNAR